MRRLIFAWAFFAFLCAGVCADEAIIQPDRLSVLAIPGDDHTCEGTGFEANTSYRVRLIAKMPGSTDDLLTWTQITSRGAGTDATGRFILEDFGNDTFNPGIPKKEALILVEKYVNGPGGGWKIKGALSVYVLGYQSGG